MLEGEEAGDGALNFIELLLVLRLTKLPYHLLIHDFEVVPGLGLDVATPLPKLVDNLLIVISKINQCDFGIFFIFLLGVIH